MERDLLILKIYSVLLTIGCAVLFFIVFKMLKNKNFAEINVERINVIESDGKLRMVISNKSRQHPGVMDGIVYNERAGQRPPGMMFFNGKGDELGGLVFDGDDTNGQGGSLTFDKFRGDQTIQFIHDENADGTYFAGLKLNDQNLPLNDLINKQKEISKLPSKEAQDMAYKELQDQGLLMTERVRIGKDYDKSAIIKLKDNKGRVRIEIKVAASGQPQLNFLDEHGKTTLSLPERK